MAAAAAELAEGYQRKGRGAATRFQGPAILIIPGAATLGIIAAANGNTAEMIPVTVIVLTIVAHLAFNPAARPQNVARSLEASSRIAAKVDGASTPARFHPAEARTPPRSVQTRRS